MAEPKSAGLWANLVTSLFFFLIFFWTNLLPVTLLGPPGLLWATLGPTLPVLPCSHAPDSTPLLDAAACLTHCLGRPLHPSALSGLLSSWLVHHLGAHHTHIPSTSVNFRSCMLIPAQHTDLPSGPTRHPPIPPSQTSQHQSPGVLCAPLEWL